MARPARSAATPVRGATFGAFVEHARRKWKALTCLHFGFAMHTGYGYAIAIWTPAFCLRHHDWSIGQVGLVLGVILLTAGPLGAIAGGTLTDAWLKRGVKDAYLRVGALVCLVDSDGKQQRLFLGPDGGSMSLVSGGQLLQVISSDAPLGRALLGKCEGDEVSMQVASIRQQFEVLRVH